MVFFLTVKCNVYQRKYSFNIIVTVIAECMINSVLPMYDVYHTVVSDGKTFMKFINQLPLKKILPLKYFLKALIIIFWMYETGGTVILSSSRSKPKIP